MNNRLTPLLVSAAGCEVAPRPERRAVRLEASGSRLPWKRMPTENNVETSRRWPVLRLGQLLTLLGLTGFAVSQPLLAVAGENPTIFTFAGVQGSSVLVFALLVALVPPLGIWTVLVVVGLVDGRAADIGFAVASALLAAATVVQLLKSTGMEGAWLLGPIAAATAVGFGYLM